MSDRSLFVQGAVYVFYGERFREWDEREVKFPSIILIDKSSSCSTVDESSAVDDFSGFL